MSDLSPATEAAPAAPADETGTRDFFPNVIVAALVLVLIVIMALSIIGSLWSGIKLSISTVQWLLEWGGVI